MAGGHTGRSGQQLCLAGLAMLMRQSPLKQATVSGSDRRQSQALAREIRSRREAVLTCQACTSSCCPPLQSQ